MKYIVFILTFIVLTGCDTERIADIATPQEMAQKEIIFIFPSIPEEFCYSDSLTEIWNDFARDVDGSNPQVLTIDHPIRCEDYGFIVCEKIVEGDEEDLVTMSMCTSPTDDRVCMNVFNQEYRDSEGETFEESCLLGIDAL